MTHTQIYALLLMFGFHTSLAQNETNELKANLKQ